MYPTFKCDWKDQHFSYTFKVKNLSKTNDSVKIVMEFRLTYCKKKKKTKNKMFLKLLSPM